MNNLFLIINRVITYSLIAIFFTYCNPVKKVTRFNPAMIWKQDTYLTLQQLRNEATDSILPYLEHYGALEAIFNNPKKAQYLFDTVEIIRNHTSYDLDKTLVSFSAQNAVEQITQQAQDKKIILINEAHHRSEHRVFTTQLLLKLHEQGFTHLALEGLRQKDTLLETRGFPSQKSGLYLQDPSYSNLVRTALNLGVTIISYDTYAPNSNERDSLQAVNIYNQSFAKDTSIKLLVHAGYGHVIAKEYSSSRRMGLILSKMTKTTPLVIDQTSTFEHEIAIRQNKNYQYIVQNKHIEQASVLNNKEQQYWSSSLLYDIEVIHPPLSYISNRPAYLIYGERQLYDIPVKIRQKKYLNHLIKVFDSTEPNTAVPIDQFELSNLDMKFILPKGKYRIEVYDTKSELLAIANIFFN